MKNSYRSDPLTQSVHAARSDVPSAADVRRWQHSVATLAGVSAAPTAAAAMSSSASAAGTSAVVGTSKASLGATTSIGSGSALGGLVGGGAKMVTSALVTVGLVGGGAVAYQVSADSAASPRDQGATLQSAAPSTRLEVRSMPQSVRQKPAAPQVPAAEDVVTVDLANDRSQVEATARIQSAHVSSARVKGDSAKSTPVAPSREYSAAEEARVIEAARRALATNPAQTLSLVQRHQQQFPEGALGVERRVLLIEALYRLGRQTEAAHALEAFRRDNPHSAHLRRLDQLLKVGAPP